MRRALTLFIAAVVVFTVPELWAARNLPFSETTIIIELNATDQDAGIQIFLDAEGWNEVKVFDPNGNQLCNFKTSGSVGVLGITELFFESEEPSLEELPLEEFLALFPEGEYTFRGTTIDGAPLVGSATLTHVIPDAPVLISPSGNDVDPSNTVVAWAPVADPPGSEIIGYQVIVERERPSLLVFSVDLSAAATSVTVPPEFMEPKTEYKFEVLAIEAGGNKTISEAVFKTSK
jgi:hypothetical protein